MLDRKETWPLPFGAKPTYVTPSLRASRGVKEGLCPRAWSTSVDELGRCRNGGRSYVEASILSSVAEQYVWEEVNEHPPSHSLPHKSCLDLMSLSFLTEDPDADMRHMICMLQTFQ